LSLVVMLFSLIFRWQLVSSGDVISLDIRLAVIRWWWCYVAWCWDGSYSLLVMLCCLMLRWHSFATC